MSKDDSMTSGTLPPILVVDDNHDNAEIIRQYLEIRGYPITVAHDGDEALALFETVRPALVLLDVMMPGRDGWEVCRLMRQHPTLGRTVRIVMVTALDEWHDKQEALQTGADDYVEKPFDLPTLATTVQRNIAMQRAKAS
jgi:CheY-like chemotaxis protein